MTAYSACLIIELWETGWACPDFPKCGEHRKAFLVLKAYACQLDWQVNWMWDYTAGAARAGRFRKHPQCSRVAPLSSLSSRLYHWVSLTETDSFLTWVKSLPFFPCNFYTTCQLSFFQLNLCVLDPTGNAVWLFFQKMPRFCCPNFYLKCLCLLASQLFM